MPAKPRERGGVRKRGGGALRGGGRGEGTNRRKQTKYVRGVVSSWPIGCGIERWGL